MTFFTYILYIFRRIISNRNSLIIRSLFIICVKMCNLIVFNIRKMCIFASSKRNKERRHYEYYSIAGTA